MLNKIGQAFHRKGNLVQESVDIAAVMDETKLEIRSGARGLLGDNERHDAMRPRAAAMAPGDGIRPRRHGSLGHQFANGVAGPWKVLRRYAIEGADVPVRPSTTTEG